MRNPWLELASAPPYVLPGDREPIDRLAKKTVDRTHAINLGSIPEPFIGIPETASVVLLSLRLPVQLIFPVIPWLSSKVHLAVAESKQVA